jgi:DNA helicase HerA-like ATPase
MTTQPPILGPTGSGKSTLLLNLALQDIEAGIGVGVLDPKGDLITDLLERIPSRHRDRLVLIDPSQREQPVGLNVLTCSDPNQREVVCDGIVTIFKKTYERFWGPRTDDVLRAALLTLMRDPSATLCEVPLLLLNRTARAQLTAELDDPAGLKLFWAEYEQMAPGQQLQVVART